MTDITSSYDAAETGLLDADAAAKGIFDLAVYQRQMTMVVAIYDEWRRRHPGVSRDDEPDVFTAAAGIGFPEMWGVVMADILPGVLEPNLGVTEDPGDGLPYYALAGARFGVRSNKGALITAGTHPTNNVAYIAVPSDNTDANMTPTIAWPTIGDGDGLAYRVLDEDNFFKVVADLNVGKWVAVRFQNGVPSQSYPLPQSPVPADSQTVTAVLNGATHTIYIGGLLVGSFTDPAFRTIRRFGPISGGDITSRFDNVGVPGPVPGGGTTPPPVNRKPGPPGAPVLVGGNGQANASWVAPTDLGVPATIVGYDVSIYNAATNALVKTVQVGNVVSTVVTGLTNGVAVYGKVVARNTFGASDPSNAGGNVTPTGTGKFRKRIYTFTGASPPTNAALWTGPVVDDYSDTRPSLNTTGAPAPGVPATNYVMTVDYVEVLPAGQHELAMLHDDGGAVWVRTPATTAAADPKANRPTSATSLFYNWANQAATSDLGTITVAAGGESVPIHEEMYQAGGDAVLTTTITPIDPGGGGGGGGGLPTSRRNPFEWWGHRYHFANQPIAAGITGTPCPLNTLGDGQRGIRNAQMGMRTYGFSNRVFDGRGGSTNWDVIRVDTGAFIMSFVGPATLSHDQGFDIYLTVLESTGTTWHEMYFYTEAEGANHSDVSYINNTTKVIRTGDVRSYPARGGGPGPGWNGAGIQTGKGMVRLWHWNEIAAGNIEHAIPEMLYLNINVGFSYPSHVWPAQYHDTDESQSKGAQVHGELIFIPSGQNGMPNHNPESMGFATSNEGKLAKAIAYALKYYGGTPYDRNHGTDIQLRGDHRLSTNYGGPFQAENNNGQPLYGELSKMTPYLYRTNMIQVAGYPAVGVKGSGSPIVPYATALV